jgi:hypothetical protein
VEKSFSFKKLNGRGQVNREDAVPIDKDCPLCCFEHPPVFFEKAPYFLTHVLKGYVWVERRLNVERFALSADKVKCQLEGRRYNTVLGVREKAPFLCLTSL